MNYFFINWLRYARQLFPSFLRKVKHIAWISALLKPVMQMYDEFNAFADREKYLMSFRFQKKSIEKLLNEEYNSNGIYIEDTNSTLLPWYTFDKGDGQPAVFVFDKIDNQPALYTYDKTDFFLNVNYIVWVPVAVTFDENEMRALINRYNHFPKKFSIQTY